MFKNKSLAAVALIAAAPFASADLSESGQFVDGVAAIVDEGIVMRSQLIEETSAIVTRAQQEGIPLPPPDILEEQILERLIIKEIQLQRAERIGLTISDQMLNNVIANIAAEQKLSLAQMPDFLATQGVNYQDFRRGVREELTLDQLRRIDVGQRINVSRRELEQCLLDLETNVVANSNYNLSHILIPLPNAATAAQIETVKAVVDSVYQQLTEEEADFRQMAIRYSEGQTALEGGSLGWLPGEQVPSIFTDVLAPMRAGDISEPFRTTGAFHIIKVDDMRSAVERSTVDQVKARHILVTPNEIIDEQTAKQKAEDALEQIREGADFEEVARLVSDDPASGPLGGDLGWAGPGTFVPEFEAMIDSLEINEISEPFQSPFGWHVVQVLERRVYDNTEDLKEQNCSIRIRNGKLEDETQLWIRRLRDEAFVDVKI